MEVWKDIAESSGYQVSDNGQIRSLRTRKPCVLKQRILGKYLIVVLTINGRKQARSVHRLVAKAFVPNPENKPEVNHINGDKLDNRAENLEWVTHAENLAHAAANHLMRSGTSSPRAKLSKDEIACVRSMFKPYSREFGVTALAKQFGVCVKTIQSIVRGRTYKNEQGQLHPPTLRHVPEDIRREIRACYRKGVPGFGLPSLAKKFGLGLKTVANIVKEI